MAVQLPQGLYSHYTNVFDTTPLMQANLQRKAKLDAEKAAKEESLNQFFNDKLKTLNSAGISSVHQPGLFNRIKNINEFWSSNSEKIKKGGIDKSKLDELFQDAFFYVNNAKNRDKTLLEIGKARAEGKLSVEEEDMANVISNLGKSVDDVKSFKDDGVTDWGWGDLVQMTPDLDIETESKAYDLLTKNLTPIEKDDYSRRVFDKERGEIIIPRVKEYTTQQKKFAADAAVGMVVGNSDLAKKLRKSYNRLLDGSIEESENGSVSVKSKELEELDKYYQSVYGEDKFISNVEQVAQAKAIKRLADATTEKPKEDVNYGQRQQDKRINISLNTGKGAGSEDISDYDLLSRYDNKVKGVSLLGLGNVKFIELKDIGAQDLKLISADGAVSPYKFGEYRGFLVRDDGDWEGSGGKVISRSNVARANLDRTTVSEANRLKKILPPKGQPKKKTYKGLDKNGNPIFE